jgi:hypothetical protein
MVKKGENRPKGGISKREKESLGELQRHKKGQKYSSIQEICIQHSKYMPQKKRTHALPRVLTVPWREIILRNVLQSNSARRAEDPAFQCLQTFLPWLREQLIRLRFAERDLLG